MMMRQLLDPRTGKLLYHAGVKNRGTTRFSIYLARIRTLCYCRTRVSHIIFSSRQRLCVKRSASSANSKKDSKTANQEKIINGNENNDIQTTIHNGNKESNNNNRKQQKQQPQQSVWLQLQSIPNIITISRIACTPMLAYWIIVSHDYPMAIAGCFIAGLSDGLDGYLARNYNMATVLGSYLDPIADKFIINTLAVSLWTVDILPTPLVGLWFAKDIFLLFGSAYMFHSKMGTANLFKVSTMQQPLEIHPSSIAKVNTALQFATIGMGLLVEPVPSLIVCETAQALNVSCWVTGASSVAALSSYLLVDPIQRQPKQQQQQEKNDHDTSNN